MNKPLCNCGKCCPQVFNEQELRQVLDALRNLYDEQNGPPLCTRETQWANAMTEALCILKKYNA